MSSEANRLRTTLFASELISPPVIESILLFAGVGILLLTATPNIHADGTVRFDAVRSLLRGDLPPIKYSLVQPLLGVPIVHLARLFYIGSWTAIAYFNITVFLVLAFPLWSQLSRLYNPRIATRALLLLLCASMLPHHLRHYYGELLSAMAITTGILYARDRPVWAVVLMAIGVANTPVLLAPVGLTALVLIRHAPAVMAAAVAAALLIGAELYAKFGTVFSSPYLEAGEKGYQTVLPYSGLAGFSYPIFFGVLSVLFSFGKGLVWFIPGLLAFIDRNVTHRLRLRGAPAGKGLAAFCISIVLVYSSWWAWYGGDYWGPRFFLILCFPAALALAVATISPATKTRAWIALALLALSSWVGINGTVFAQRSMDLCWQNNYELEFLCWYVPEFSALWRPFVTHDLRALLGAIWNSQESTFALWQVVTWFCLSVSVLHHGRTAIPHSSYQQRDP